MKKMWLILLLVLFVVGIGGMVYYFTFVAYPLDKTGMINDFVVKFEEPFETEDDKSAFVVGETVNIYFRNPDNNKEYKFLVEGVDAYDVRQQDDGYCITFRMPSNNVKVSYTTE